MSRGCGFSLHWAYVSHAYGAFLRPYPAGVNIAETRTGAYLRSVEVSGPFFGSIVREDRNALDLLRADYTLLNERLARHYGIPNVKGSRMRRVSLRGRPDGRDEVRGC